MTAGLAFYSLCSACAAERIELSDVIYCCYTGKTNWEKYVINGVIPKNAAKCSVKVRNFTPGFSKGTCLDAMEFPGE